MEGSEKILAQGHFIGLGNFAALENFGFGRLGLSVWTGISAEE